MTKILPFRLAVPVRRFALAAAVALSVTPALVASASSDTAVTTRNETIVREAFQRWAAGASIFPTLLAPDVVWTIPGSGPVAGTYRGLTDFVERASRPLLSRLATPLVPQLHHIWAVADKVIVRFDASATTTGGRPYRNQYVWIFRMKDGVVAEAEAFLDLAAYHQVVDNNPPRQQ
jgi:ketosteroid isomerase-like protein